jgi:hypothetical protein
MVTRPQDTDFGVEVGLPARLLSEAVSFDDDSGEVMAASVSAAVEGKALRKAAVKSTVESDDPTSLAIAVSGDHT